MERVCKPKVRVGLQVLVEALVDALGDRRIGVVANHTSVTPDFDHILDILYSALRLNIRAVFAPEHGIRGAVPAGPVRGTVDERTGLPVYSLYGASCRPPEDIVKRLDVIVYDIQDVGVRFYTYISTLYHVIEAAGRAGVKVLVLDRPNPITGASIEGPVLDLEYRSFIGVWELPVRYGMTAGELALLFNHEAGLGADIEVVRMEGWRREMWFDETGLPWVPPSPNMPTFNTAIVYPGTCLLEGTNVSEGRGTTKPFEMVGAPWIDEYQLIGELESLPIRGVKYRPSRFMPLYGKYAGKLCRGVQVYVSDRELFEPVKFGLLLIWAIKVLYPDHLQFVRRGGRYYFDLLVGCDTIRRLVEEGCDPEELVSLSFRELEAFDDVRSRYVIY